MKIHMGELTLAYKAQSYSTDTLGRATCNARMHHVVANEPTEGWIETWKRRGSLYGSVAVAIADTTVTLTSHTEPVNKEYILRKIGVIGSGLMGAGIAQVAAQAGLHVLMMDQKDEALQSAVGRIQNGLKRLEERGRLQEDVDTIMGRIETTPQLPEFAGLGGCPRNNPSNSSSQSCPAEDSRR